MRDRYLIDGLFAAAAITLNSALGRSGRCRRRRGPLASRAADYVHGAVLPADGGWLAR